MEALLTPKVVSIESAAEAFGTRLKPVLDLLRSSLDKAVTCETTPEDSRTSDLRSKLSSHFGLVDDIQETLSDTDVLRDHISAIAEASAALGWVIEDDPSNHMSAVTEELTPFVTALRAKQDPSHGLLADCVQNFISEVSDYVADNYKNPLSFTETTDTNDEHSAEHLKDFRNTVTDAAVLDFQKASETLSGNDQSHIISILAQLLTNAMNAVYDFIVTASSIPEKPSDDDRHAMLSNIITHIQAVNSKVADVLPSAPFFNHAKSIEDSMTMLSWLVADEKPTSFIIEAEGASGFYLNKILMASKNTPDAPKHRVFVDSVKAIFAALRKYIKEQHPTGLRYGIGLSAPKTSSHVNGVDKGHDDADENDVESSGNYISKFKTLLNDPLSSYVKASDAIGGELASQTALFVQAWNVEAKFLETAYTTPEPKPDELIAMVKPIGEKMAEVSSIAEAADPRGPLTQHLMAVSESIAALGWVAVDEKATAFIGDSAGTAQFYLNKVKMDANKTDNPKAHREWTKALEKLWSELKKYVKEYHTQKLVWNPPKVRKVAKRSITTDEDQEDDSGTKTYVSAFSDLINGPLDAYVSACNAIGGDVVKQAEMFRAAWKAEEEFLGKAFELDKPEDVQEMLTPIGTKMGEVAAIAEGADPRGPLTQHLMAVSESVPALGWVAVDEKATGFVGESSEPGQFYIGKVRMGAKKTDNPEAHREWAKALEKLWSELKKYVKEYHTQKLVWNPPKNSITKNRKAQYSASGDTSIDDSRASLDSISAFKALIDGPLASFVSACSSLGGEVAEQAKILDSAWQAEFDLIKKAKSTPKPKDEDSMQSLLMPIGSKMNLVSSLAEAADPRGPLTQHLMAVSESVGALGWVAVDEKATAFVGDSASTGQFYITKVKMSARQSDRSADHLQWATALESLWSELKAYVKEYHTQRLSWKN